jgi:hypothetical protein
MYRRRKRRRRKKRFYIRRRGKGVRRRSRRQNIFYNTTALKPMPMNIPIQTFEQQQAYPPPPPRPKPMQFGNRRLRYPKRSAEGEQLIHKLMYGGEERKAGKADRIAKRRAERQRLKTPAEQIKNMRKTVIEPMKKNVSEQKEVLAGMDADFQGVMAAFRKFDEQLGNIEPTPIERVNPGRPVKKQRDDTSHNYERPKWNEPKNEREERMFATNLPEVLNLDGQGSVHNG